MPSGTVLAWVTAVLSVERVSYIWISRHPAMFRSWCSTWLPHSVADPVGVVQGLFYVFKGIQIGVFAWWCHTMGEGTLWPPLGTPGALAGGGLLMLAGQVLNVGVFRRLGTEGVFYGNRFGRPLPHVRAFPFSIVAHPQYVGTVLTIWGFFLVMRFPHDDWYAVPFIETTLYAIGARFEA